MYQDQRCAKGGSYIHDAIMPWCDVRKMKRTAAMRNEDVNFTLSNKLKHRRIHGIRACLQLPRLSEKVLPAPTKKRL